MDAAAVIVVVVVVVVTTVLLLLFNSPSQSPSLSLAHYLVGVAGVLWAALLLHGCSLGVVVCTILAL